MAGATRDRTSSDRLSALRLQHASGATAEIYQQGAHITSWRPAGGQEVMFMSRESLFETGVPIRGGIPVIFPQFSERGPLPKHGFARVQPWEVTEQGTDSTGAAYARLRLADSPDTLALWPHRFTAEMSVVLDETLAMTLRVTNRGDQGFTFTTALHTYFRVGNVTEVSVEGLEGSSYLGTQPGEQSRKVTGPVRIQGETDGVYGETSDRLLIRDPSLGRAIVIEKSGFPDAVVWNPWIDKARAMSDFGDDEYLTMLCVEAGTIAEPVRLRPGEAWSGTQILSVEGL